MSNFNLVRGALLLLVLGMLGCDPGYTIRLENGRGEPVTFSVAPDNFVGKDSLNFSKHRVDGGAEGKTRLYTLGPRENILLYGTFGNRPGPAGLRIDSIRVYIPGDTLIFGNKQAIIDRLVKRNRRNYYIEIK